jgi:flagellar hook-associated protein 3 FlgL
MSTFISSRSISDSTRISIMKVQERLAEAQKEVTTGRLADVGKSLGHRTGAVVTLRDDHARLNAIIETNAGVKARLDVTQSALQSLVESGQQFVSALIAARDSSTGPGVITREARDGLAALIDAFNTTLSGAYVFAGINADVRPLDQYFGTPPPASRQSVASAFQAEFGIGQGDAAASSISAADMQAFLDGPFAQLFEEPAWSTAWSQASSQNVRNRISTSELLTTSVNANESAMRKLVRAYTMVADLGLESLNEETYKTVIDTAIVAVAEALQEISVLQSNLGTTQQRVAQANYRMSIQINIIAKHISAIEGVDPHEASIRLSTLLTQVETSYALTARIEKLSLIKFL